MDIERGTVGDDEARFVRWRNERQCWQSLKEIDQDGVVLLEVTLAGAGPDDVRAAIGELHAYLDEGRLSVPVTRDEVLHKTRS